MNIIARALFSALFSTIGPFSLGMGSLIIAAVYFPSGLRAVQRWAQAVENSVDFASLPDQAAVLVNLLVDDTSITIMFFILTARFVVALINELLKSSPKPPVVKK
ncbi:MAG: hypothetical protein AAFN74_08185 [Myxococcota bacterium]